MIEEYYPTSYKIVELKNGKMYTLFHGTNGTRELEKYRWIEAEKRNCVSDGKDGKTYTAGFHFFASFRQAVDYLKRFKKPRHLAIVPIHARGIRLKENGRNDVYLADAIFFL